MKIITTAYRENETISWQDLEHFLQENVYEEDFLVLADTKHPDYVQIAEIDDVFVLEVRLYMADNQSFQHFRKYIDSVEKSINVFKIFYHDEAMDFDDWEDVSSEFDLT